MQTGGSLRVRLRSVVDHNLSVHLLAPHINIHHHTIIEQTYPTLMIRRAPSLLMLLTIRLLHIERNKDCCCR